MRFGVFVRNTDILPKSNHGILSQILTLLYLYKYVPKPSMFIYCALDF